MKDKDEPSEIAAKVRRFIHIWTLTDFLVNSALFQLLNNMHRNRTEGNSMETRRDLERFQFGVPGLEVLLM